LNSPTRHVANSPILIGTAIAVMLLVIAAVYLPDIGRGFVKDDFGWIRDARAARVDLARLVQLSHPGFYRPLVTATFVVDYVVHGVNARGYGFTNLALYLACIAAIWALLREAGPSPPAAAVGAFAWALNPHGINMAVVWISGRTSLLLTLCAALCGRAFLRRQRVAGSLLLFAALLAKEEATVLPVIVIGWLLALRDERGRDLVLDVVATSWPLIVYALLRTQTPALTPATAPWFYRPTADLQLLAWNALEYLDRGATFFALIALAAWAVYGPRRVELSGRLVAVSAMWFVSGYILTIWIPVRSSLYAVFPSVGSALLCAGVVDAYRSVAVIRQKGDRWLAAALTSALFFVPVYQKRNDRWVEPARLSARAIEAIAASPPASVRGTVVFEDENAQFASFADAFGDFAGDAVREATHRGLDARIESAGARWTGPIAARYKLTRGRIDRVTP
jgi:hypothetical protein